MINKIIKTFLSILIILHLYIQGIYIFISQYINLYVFLSVLGVIYGYFGFYLKSKISTFIVSNLLIFLILIPYSVLFFFVLININIFLNNPFLIIYSVLILSILPIGILLINKNLKLRIYTYVLFSLFLMIPFTFILGMRGSPDDEIPFSIFLVLAAPFIIFPLAIIEHFLGKQPKD